MSKTNLGLVEYAKAQLGRPYWMGTFGNIATESLLAYKKKQLPKYYTATDFPSQFGQRVHDCVGLIKGYIWSDGPDAVPVYASNGCPDINEAQMYANAKEKGAISTLPEIPGVLVFLTGHVGIYIGGGYVIEARGHAYGVVKTALKGRGWTKWAKCPYIDYVEADTSVTEQPVVSGAVQNVQIEYIPTTNTDVWSSTRTIKPAGLVLHSTAMPGYDAYAIQKNFNRHNRGASIHAAVDDKRVVQCLPWTKRAGHVGSGKNGSFNNSHIGVEMCEPVGLTYNENGSVITAYNPPAGYFKAVWNNAVNLFADLCAQFGLDPLGKNVIVSHAEAHALGCGDNHADTAHWFVWEKKTMDDFRRAVKERMTMEKEDDEDMTQERFNELWHGMRKELQDNDAGTYQDSIDAREWAIKTGMIKGGDILPDGTPNYMWGDLLTREQMAILLWRFAKMMGKT